MYTESLIKFSQMPADVREKISAPDTMQTLEQLEKKYRIQLSTMFIMIMVGDIPRDEIDDFLVENFQLRAIDAKKIKLEIIDKILNNFPSFYFLDFDNVEPVQAPASTSAQAPAIEHGTASLIQRAYRGDAKEHEQVLRIEEGLNKKMASDPAVLSKEFYASVQAKDASKVIAVVRLMAQTGELENLLEHDEKLRSFLIATWQREYGPVAAEEFKLNPTAPKNIQKFLEYILQARLGMSEGQAARVGANISNIYKRTQKPQYAKMAYFDAGVQEFRWLRE